ncbi:MAG: hypothetical protein A4E37_01777 [Methanoregulaceae archaeon PtaB.Bin056]|jgi:hypothetical protein|nr:MAG: hypothetical protein A4E37_01777 [Methanoregulaceae archaeon PtaB.Bin056]
MTRSIPEWKDETWIRVDRPEYSSSLALHGHIREDPAIGRHRWAEFIQVGGSERGGRQFTMNANQFAIKATLNTGRRETFP